MRRCFEAEQDSNAGAEYGATHLVQPVTPLAASSSSEYKAAPPVGWHHHAEVLRGREGPEGPEPNNGPVRLRPKSLPEAYHSALPVGQHLHAEVLRGRVGPERRRLRRPEGDTIMRRCFGA